jgi:hypothetical protein
MDLPYLRLLAPEAVAAWEAERTTSWLRANDVIACPHAGCGALIQRMPASATSAGGGGNGGLAGRSAPQRGPGTGDTTEAAAHRERHRYRCGACRLDFCDSCLAAPYHKGFTCRQARAPDCLLCGGKVDEDRLEQLLPAAASATAADHDSATQPGVDGGGDSFSAGAGDAAALTVVQRARRADLLRALKSLELDTVWCLERRDLEKVRRVR